ncbi:ATP-dependent helicase HrpB [Billgrantia montanilacus]|uniref:ATP-dependent helicase HrpB n=1 Tax=Billgrantia montanilacus TaxID=2282305 RepID=A0A368TPS7_9GAMM|nr:ATP-dependent helicase HrpB [Halomonas montanilacus]RCV86326.1 ATP-dependent helicase HrpB [Halomonas montanilacus]
MTASASSALPIETRLDDIHLALAGHNRAVLVAEPGAGKTTRVPLALLEAPWCGQGKLLLLEPRRVAARLAAGFMADSLGEPVGETVGYRMRGESRVGANTRLEVVTQGILTRMLQDDPLLEGVAGVIFDEFHERSLEADLGLALALDAQSVRDDLRLLVMSATLDVEALLGVLGQDTPVIDCPGRAYPVKTRYFPVNGGRDMARQQCAAVIEAMQEEAGDVLAILPGVAEIRRLARELSARRPDLSVMELHGRLPLDAQRRALRPDPQGHRRVVLATAIAESSLTVEGVRIVVDAGQERVPVFQPSSGLTRLETRRVNRASADQRRGRAGRQGPGLCLRLWAEEQPLIPHGEPEIRQADLAPLAFELARWGVTDIAALAWVTPPPTGALAAGRDLLRRLGVIDEACHLTALGRRCVRWPTHPRLAVMLERAHELEALPLACALVAALEGRDLDGEQDLEPALQARLADARRFGQWHQEARRLARIGGCGLEVKSLAPLGELLALAYPERIGQRLAPGRFRLAGGGLATLPEEHPLAHAELLVAADLDGQASGARIYRGVALAADRLAGLYPETAEWRANIEWSEEQGRLVGEQLRGLGAVVLARRPLQQLPPETVRQALLEALRRRGVLPFDEAADQLRGRVALLRRELGSRCDQEDWPDWSTAALLDDIESWLGLHLDSITRLEAVERLPLARYLLDSLDWSLRSRLDDLAPERLGVPSGSHVRLDYRPCLEGGEPVLAVKLQELFGWRASPCVAGGRVPVLLHLLSPARRPLQVTADLASFWANGYPEVRREMRGRYPKHPWPEDPLTAEASARTKRRN